MSPPPVSDGQLIARVVVSDDRHAFSELVRRHQSSVRATLRKLAGGNAALADDLAQEAFLLAYRNLKSFRQDAKFSTWLYRIAYNVCLSRRLVHPIALANLDLAGELAGAEGDEPARVFEEAERRARLLPVARVDQRTNGGCVLEPKKQFFMCQHKKHFPSLE